MGFVAIIIFAVSGALLIYQTIYEIALEKRESLLRKERIGQVTEYFQEYLDQTARKITELPVDQNIISEIQSTIYKKNLQAIGYLWLSDKKGEFVFGVPSFVFAHLNKYYDKDRASIEKDGSYSDRNDYLLKNLERDSSGLFSDGGRYMGVWDNFDSLVFSSPVIGIDGQVIGDLYIKLFDAHRGSQYNRIFYYVIFPTAEVFFGFSAVFLWFLLPAWIYIDARQRDVKRPFMWALLAVFSFIFGLLIYLITRPSQFKTFHCPGCQGELNGTKAFCPHCGMDLSGVFCPQCQYPIKPEWQFCPSCCFDMRKKAEDKISTAEEPSQVGDNC